jgi:cytochrome c-type biogenesis protein CcmF
VVSSVHAFAQSSIGTWFVSFLALILVVCLGAYLKNRDYLKSENQLDAIVSRESSFLFNNLLLLVGCVAVLSGTLFPVFSEWFTGNRISVGAPFFNKVNIPIGLLLLFLTGVGPLLAWRKTSTESLKRNFGVPLAIGVAAGMIAFAMGFREFYSLVCLILCVFVTSTITMEFYRGAKVIRARSGASLIASAVDLTMRNTRRYGGYIVHMGMVLVFVGLAGAAFNRDTQKEMQLGSTMQIGPYTLVLQSVDSRPERNYTAERMIIEVLRDSKPIMMLYPEKRRFVTTVENGTMVAIYSTLKEDLYVVYAGQSPDTQLPVIHAYLNPLVKWIWLGGAVVVLGTLVALLPNRRAVLVLAGAAEPSTAAQSLRPGLTPSVIRQEGHD